MTTVRPLSLTIATILLAAGAMSPAAAESFAMGDAFETREPSPVHVKASSLSGPSVSISASILESRDGAWGVDLAGSARRSRAWLPDGAWPERTGWQFEAEAWRASGPVVMFVGATVDRAGRFEPGGWVGRRAYAGFEFAFGKSGTLLAETGWTAPSPGLAIESDLRLGWRLPFARRWSAGFDLTRVHATGWQDHTAWLTVSGRF